ncbi:hypothetical protein QM261_18380, partial [Acinetobacter baumannii]|uniref:hypothetical protein n=1 Tax=Acinetobacter baumannii TaxID=470 RepID=UPI0024B6DD4F
IYHLRTSLNPRTKPRRLQEFTRHLDRYPICPANQAHHPKYPHTPTTLPTPLPIASSRRELS